MARGFSSKPANVDAADRHWPEAVAQGAYVAKLVSPAELRQVSCARGWSDDHGFAWIAGRQLGLVATWQLKALGISYSTIARRVRRGALHRVHRGVLLVGHAVPLPGARELAAVLACGDGALVSHRSAALLWGLTEFAGDEVEISVVGRHRGSREGYRVHRARRLVTDRQLSDTLDRARNRAGVSAVRGSFATKAGRG